MKLDSSSKTSRSEALPACTNQMDTGASAHQEFLVMCGALGTQQGEAESCINRARGPGFFLLSPYKERSHALVCYNVTSA